MFSRTHKSSFIRQKQFSNFHLGNFFQCIFPELLDIFQVFRCFCMKIFAVFSCKTKTRKWRTPGEESLTVSRREFFAFELQTGASNFCNKWQMENFRDCEKALNTSRRSFVDFYIFVQQFSHIFSVSLRRIDKF